MLISMKNITKLVMLGLLLIPFAAMINMGNASAANVNVKMQAGASDPSANKGFDPKEVHIAVGDTVVWFNDDAATHTVTSGVPGQNDTGSLFDSMSEPKTGLVKPTKTWQHTFDKAGEFPYFCSLHPYMVGEVYVGGEAAPPTVPPPTEMPGAMVLPTDNKSVNVEVTLSAMTLEPNKEITINLRFLDPTTNLPLNHTNFDIKVTDSSGNAVVDQKGLHVHPGTYSQSVTFASTGSYTLSVNVIGTGIPPPPFDTSHSGLATTSLNVVPEFPLTTILPLVLAFIAVVAVMRIRSTKNLPGL